MKAGWQETASVETCKVSNGRDESRCIVMMGGRFSMQSACGNISMSSDFDTEK